MTVDWIPYATAAAATISAVVNGWAARTHPDREHRMMFAVVSMWSWIYVVALGLLAFDVGIGHDQGRWSRTMLPMSLAVFLVVWPWPAWLWLADRRNDKRERARRPLP